MKALIWIIIIVLVVVGLWKWIGGNDETVAPADTDTTEEVAEGEVEGAMTTGEEVMMEDADHSTEMVDADAMEEEKTTE